MEVSTVTRLGAPREAAMVQGPARFGHALRRFADARARRRPSHHSRPPLENDALDWLRRRFLDPNLPPASPFVFICEDCTDQLWAAPRLGVALSEALDKEIDRRLTADLEDFGVRELLGMMLSAAGMRASVQHLTGAAPPGDRTVSVHAWRGAGGPRKDWFSTA